MMKKVQDFFTCQLDEEEIDIYIKDEGYADVKFLTDKAKDWAHENSIPNSLSEFGDTFCGRSVWNQKTRKGLYKCGFRLRELVKLIKKLDSTDLKVESEIDLDII